MLLVIFYFFGLLARKGVLFIMGGVDLADLVFFFFFFFYLMCVLGIVIIFSVHVCVCVCVCVWCVDQPTISGVANLVLETGSLYLKPAE